MSEYYTVRLENSKYTEKIAAFDLDWTVIKPIFSNKFPRNKDDWMIFPEIKNYIQQLYSENYTIVIFTNQGGSKFNIEEFKQKLSNISTVLKVPLITYISTKDGYYRKPSIGLWTLLEKNYITKKIDINSSFYIGDAAGRKYDFSDSDYKFALNIGLQFYSSKDGVIDKQLLPIPQHPLKNISNKPSDFIMNTKNQEMIILVGPPASSKSSWAKKWSDTNNYSIACQDDIGTKIKLIKFIKNELANNKSVIVDKLNAYVKDRTELIEIAKSFKIEVRIIWFDIPREISEHLCKYRENVNGKHVPSIVFNKFYSTNKGLEIPCLSEGVGSISRIRFEVNEEIIENNELFYNYLT
jgi:bifunctional polynucleotide phosphatase/kinase